MRLVVFYSFYFIAGFQRKQSYFLKPATFFFFKMTTTQSLIVANMMSLWFQLHMNGALNKYLKI